MANIQPHRFKTISEFHQFRELPKPEHPLVSVINLESIKQVPANETSLIKDFYSIALKRNFNAKIKYGQQEYDFDEGIMFFISPGQVFRIEVEKDSTLKQSGWMLLLHPDFLWNTPLAKTIKQYEYFDYSVNEALFLSEKEETTIAGIMQRKITNHNILNRLEDILTEYFNSDSLIEKGLPSVQYIADTLNAELALYLGE
jgi:AraC family transcriptional activator of pobA